jgi:hypothetical protein
VRAVADILFAVANQLVFHDAMEGRPTSVTKATVYRWDQGDDDTAPELVLAPSVEASPATTTDAVCGRDQADPRAIPLTSTAGVRVGRVYLLTGADARMEWAQVDAVEAGAVASKHPLLNAYASGAAFQSTRIQATIDTAWTSDLSNLDASDSVTRGAPMFRVRWEYVVAGVACVADTYFNLVRYAGKHGVWPKDIEAIKPGWIDALPTDHRYDQGRRLIDEAYTEVRVDLLEIEVDASQVADTFVIDELVRYMAAGDPEKYVARRDALLRIVRRAPIRDVSGAAAAVPAASIGLSRR